MQSRRNFIGKVATGLAGTLAASNVLGANDRIRLGIIGPGARGTEILREALACPNTECVGAADVYTRRLEEVQGHRARRQDLPRLPPSAGRQDHRRRPDRHPAAPALRALHRRARCRQARLPGKDHGVHGGPRQEDARRVANTLAASARCRSATSGPLRPHCPTPLSFLKPELMGKITAIHAPHVPQHAARQAAVGAPGLPGHDAREHRLEERSWARRRSGRSTPTATSTGGSSGITRAATSTRTCATSLPSGTR